MMRCFVERLQMALLCVCVRHLQCTFVFIARAYLSLSDVFIATDRIRILEIDDDHQNFITLKQYFGSSKRLPSIPFIFP